jgi:predicted DsbA family dithiol-disulfide isomerase
LFAGRLVDIGAMMAQLRQTAEKLDLPFGDRRYTYNSRRAQTLGKWAESHGKGDAFHLAAFQAYFAHGENIARIEVLEAIAHRAGLDPREVGDALDNSAFERAVDGDWKRAARLGIRAVPTFRVDGSTLVGAQETAAIARLLKAHGAAERTAAT